MYRLYEDDNLEKEINEIIQNNTDFSKVIKEKNNFSYYYFLSELRHSLFNWYPFKKDAKLLEIGAGYGQLTSLFVSKVNNVVAVEDSEVKCDIILNRVQNVNVINSNFMDINIDEKFDYIVLCNVFEYVKYFTDSDNPFKQYLGYLKGFLKDDGVILIAINNRLGLKYFAGFKEEHTNQFFSSINGCLSDDVVTFTKPEWIRMINDVGFDNYKFFYPFPDHEFSELINTDKFINTIPYTKKSTYFNQRSNLFDESMLNQTFTYDNMADYFSNSFLIEIRNSDKEYETDNIDFVKINNHRKSKFQTITLIHNNIVSKYPISNHAKSHIEQMFNENEGSFGKIKYLNCNFDNNSCSYEFLKEKSLMQLINESILNNNKKEFYRLLQEYYDALLYKAYETDSYASENFISIFKKKSNEKFHCHVKSNIDLDFNNIFIINNEYIAIDYEWIFNFPIPIEYIFYRTIKRNMEYDPLFNKFTSFTKIFRNLNLNMKHLELFDKWDVNLFKYIYGSIPVNNHKIIPKENLDYIENIDEYVDSLLNSKNINSHHIDLLKKDIVLNQRNIINKKNKEIKQKNKEIKQKNNHLIQKNKEFKKLLNSSSWKITKPLRKLKSIFKKG